MEKLTLRELCEALYVSRRMVQGYEQHGLVKASDRNKYGYLLYDREAVERVKKIRFLQEMGFKLREIEGIIDAPTGTYKAILSRQIERLEQEQIKRWEVIRRARKVIEGL